MKSKTIRILAVIALTISMMGIVPTAYAGDQGTNCSTDPERVRFYENAIGDTSDGNDTVINCGTGNDNLSTFSHTLSGVCKSANFRIGDNDSWNDCISSFYPIIPSGRMLCLYGQAFSGAPSIKIAGGGAQNYRHNLATGFGLDDGISSWKFMNSGAFC